jgi:hypothetical protein
VEARRSSGFYGCCPVRRHRGNFAGTLTGKTKAERTRYPITPETSLFHSNRLIPTETFKISKTIKLGGKTVELTRHNYHSNEGDLFIYVPEAKFLTAVDSVTSGYVPFQDFDLSTNFHEYLKMFDEILAYKFDNFIGGHLTDTGTRKDVEITKEYTNDVYQTVKRIHNGINERAFDDEIAKTIGPDNEFLIFKAFLDKVTRDSVAELEPRWINRLAGVDVWLPNHARAALIYVRWDDKE